MNIVVYYKEDGKEKGGVIVSTHFQHNIQQTFAVVALSDGTFKTIKMNELYHKQEFK